MSKKNREQTYKNLIAAGKEEFISEALKEEFGKPIKPLPTKKVK